LHDWDVAQNVAWFPKVMVVLGIVVACTNVLLVPLDVSTQNGSFKPSGVFPMQQLEYAFFLMTVILFFIVLPFTYFYYEGWSEDDKVQSIGHQVPRRRPAAGRTGRPRAHAARARARVPALARWSRSPTASSGPRRWSCSLRR